MRTGLRVGFCISGQGRLFRAAVRRVDQLGVSPTLVLTEGHASTDIAELCHAQGIDHVYVPRGDRKMFDARVTRACVDARLDLLVLTFDRIIVPELVAHYQGRILNVHLGLLPAFRGMRALEQAIAAGARFAGATIHQVTDELDGGPIVAQCVVGIQRGETRDSLGARVYPLLEQMFLQVLAWYAAGRATTDEAGRVWIDGARYGSLPISPAVEPPFSDGT